MRARALWLAASLTALSASCGAQPDDGLDTRGGPELTAKQLLLVNCSGCHDGTSADAGPWDVRSRSFPGSLVGQLAAGSKCRGAGMVVLNADGSGLFMDKLRAPAPCGDQMPQGTYGLSEAEISAVQQWVRDALALPTQ